MFQKLVFSQAIVKLSLTALNGPSDNIYFEPRFLGKTQNLSAKAQGT